MLACSSRDSCRPALVDAFSKLDPAVPVAQPGDVRRLRRQHPDHGPVASGARRPGRSAGRLHPRRRAVALVHGAVRQLRRGDGRRPQQGAGGIAARRAQDAHRRRSCVDRSMARQRDDGPGRDACARATSCWSKRATSFPPTARSSKASPRSTRARSPAKRAGHPREPAATSRSVTGGTRVLSDWLVVRIDGQSRARPSSTA